MHSQGQKNSAYEEQYNFFGTKHLVSSLKNRISALYNHSVVGSAEVQRRILWLSLLPSAVDIRTKIFINYRTLKEGYDLERRPVGDLLVTFYH